jgi:hypothetical protein
MTNVTLNNANANNHVEYYGESYSTSSLKTETTEKFRQPRLLDSLARGHYYLGVQKQKPNLLRNEMY